MCGICGQLSWDAPPDRDLVARMTRRIAHRGPDGEGVYVTGPVALGHRRLAVLDLTAAGTQPMTDASSRYWIAFNGEIYNFTDVRSDLARCGVAFHTRTDTEVILEAYKRWGIDCLARLNGMFAFALWDEEAQRLFLARDRVGKKPLYFRYSEGNGLVFASELKAFGDEPSVPRTVNLRALGQFLSLNYTLTSDSILDGIQKLPPAHYMVCERGRSAVVRPYWDLAAHFRTRTAYRSIDDAADALRSLIDDAVRIRLVSDVPLGVFLSGGVDSSAIAASMTNAVPAGDVRSFAMGFAEKSFSEIREARATAEYLGIHHRDMTTTADVAALLPAIVYQGDEPFGDTSMIPMYLLSEFARRHVTVCLAGDGGDELFAGYETYVADRLHRAAQACPRPVLSALSHVVQALLPVTFDKVSFDYKVRQFLAGHRYAPARAHYHWRTIFSEDEKRALVHPDLWTEMSRSDPFDAFDRFDREVEGCDPLSRSQYVDIKTWLVDDILVKADRASMAHGLEVRAPLLDYRLVEFAASLPSQWKLRGLQKKYLFRRSQRPRVPADVLARTKRGFNAPVSHWLLSSFRDRFERLTVDGVDGQPVWFNPSFVRQLWAEHGARQRDHGLKLLALINFQLWAERVGPAWG